jgi:DNA-binding MarR family transcriptional regulator
VPAGIMALVPVTRKVTSQQYQEYAEKAATLMSDGRADAMSVRLFFALLRVGNRLSKDFEVAIRQTADLSFAGYQLLFTLKAVGPINPNHLARLSSVSTASMSSLLNTLERKGLLSRSADPEDGRRTIVNLTEAGDELVSALYLENMDREQAWSQSLTQSEAETLAELLRKILTHKPRPYGVEAPTRSYWKQDAAD